MPALEDSDLNEKAVIWPRVGADANGNPIVGDPEEIDVKWNERRGRIRLGNETSDYEAEIQVDQDILIGSAIWHGELADWSGVRPEESRDVMEVIAFQKTPDLKGREYLREIVVRRLRNSWPNTSSESTGTTADTELSITTYSKRQAIGDGIDEISCIVKLLDSNGRPIPERSVYFEPSDVTYVSYNNSPQDTDDSGEARLVIRLTIPNGDGNQTITLSTRTDQDGPIGRSVQVTFTEPA